MLKQRNCTHLNELSLDEALPVGSLCKVARYHDGYQESAQKHYLAQIEEAFEGKEI